MKKVLFVLSLLIYSINVFSQQNDEVTLVVSADGSTKEEATKNALRSAIEQAYGTFVSANMNILNDEVVKDEIVTITNGNIKKYQEVASNIMPNGNFYITLEATVCISKLVNFVQSKGAETEFAGATFGMNMKMIELNKTNELKAIEHLMQQLDLMAENSNLFDLVLSMGEPSLTGNKKEYSVGGSINLVYNQNTQNYFDILYNTLLSLSMSEEEQNEYDELNINRYIINIPDINMNIYLRNPIKIFDYHLYRADVETYQGKKVIQEASVPQNVIIGEECKNHIYRNAVEKVIIADNISSPTSLPVFTGFRGSDKSLKWSMYNKDRETKYKTKVGIISDDKTIFKGFKMTAKIGKTYIGQCDFVLTIPKDDISKYTNFKVEFKK